MNTQAIQILFLKDLFLSRWPMFGYLVGGLVSVMVTCLPGESAGFIGFILMITVTIAAGIHLIGALLLGESIDMTRTFIMSLPISLLDYSLAKISVVLVAFLIPWIGMLASLTIITFVAPEAKPGILPFLVLTVLVKFPTAPHKLLICVFIFVEPPKDDINCIYNSNLYYFFYFSVYYIINKEKQYEQNSE